MEYVMNYVYIKLYIIDIYDILMDYLMDYLMDHDFDGWSPFFQPPKCRNFLLAVVRPCSDAPRKKPNKWMDIGPAYWDPRGGRILQRPNEASMDTMKPGKP